MVAGVSASSAQFKVLTNRDLMTVVYRMLHRKELTPFVLTCKLFHTIHGNKDLLTASRFCTSNSMAEWALRMRCPPHMLMCTSARHGLIDTMAFLRQWNPPCEWSSPFSNCCDVLEVAICNGQLDIVKWMRARGCGWTKDCCARAVEYDQLEILKWLRSQSPPSPWSTVIYHRIALFGRRRILDWILSIKKRPSIDSFHSIIETALEKGDFQMFLQLSYYIDGYNTGNAAVKGGNIELVEMVRCASSSGFVASSSRYCAIAAETGNLAMLQWLRGLNPPIDWGVQARVCRMAVMSGNVAMIAWLRTQNPPCEWETSMLCRFAAIKGHLDMLKWLRARQPPCEWSPAELLRDAVHRNDLGMLQWIISQDPTCAGDDLHCFAIIHGSAAVLEWLRVDQHVHFDSLKPMRLANGNNDLEKMKWLRIYCPKWFASINWNIQFATDVSDWLVDIGVR
jgi:hypothetical protein